MELETTVGLGSLEFRKLEFWSFWSFSLDLRNVHCIDISSVASIRVFVSIVVVDILTFVCVACRREVVELGEGRSVVQ